MKNQMGLKQSTKEDHNKNNTLAEASPECLTPENPIQIQRIQIEHPKVTTKYTSIREKEGPKKDSRRTVDDSNIFLIKTLVVWVLICLPGNIFALTIFWKHENSPTSQEQLFEHAFDNLSFGATNNGFNNDTLQPVGSAHVKMLRPENVTYEVSRNKF